MAVYKVIQDVEAEDKLLGPLTLKGFVYAGIAVLLGFISFKLAMIGNPIKWIFIPAFVLPMILFAVLASPLGGDQPTEVWLLSKIRFFLKPRLRIWDQSGMEELVTITAPKKVELQLTDNLSQTEVKSRLKTLSSTLDTRGWAIKNVDLNLNVAMPQTTTLVPESDRLITEEVDSAQPAPAIDVKAADDILDEKNNPTAIKFESMMQDAELKRKREVLKTIKGISEKDINSMPVVEAGIKKIAEFEDRFAKAKVNLHKQHPGSKKPDPAPQQEQALKIKPAQTVATPVTPERQAVNMEELAQSGSAFSVSTLQGLANRQPGVEQIGPNEVSISLH